MFDLGPLTRMFDLGDKGQIDVFFGLQKPPQQAPF